MSRHIRRGTTQRLSLFQWLKLNKRPPTMQIQTQPGKSPSWLRRWRAQRAQQQDAKLQRRAQQLTGRYTPQEVMQAFPKTGLSLDASPRDVLAKKKQLTNALQIQMQQDPAYMAAYAARDWNKIEKIIAMPRNEIYRQLDATLQYIQAPPRKKGLIHRASNVGMPTVVTTMPMPRHATPPPTSFMPIGTTLPSPIAHTTSPSPGYISPAPLTPLPRLGLPASSLAPQIVLP